MASRSFGLLMWFALYGSIHPGEFCPMLVGGCQNLSFFILFLYWISYDTPMICFLFKMSNQITVSSVLYFFLADLRKQMESAELKNQRLKEVFQKKIQEFRTVCYVLTGYQIDITVENQYRLTSVYAERMEDSLLFKVRKTFP